MAHGTTTTATTIVTHSSTSTTTTSSTAPSNTTAVQVALRVRPLTQQDRLQPRFSQSTNSDVLKTFNNTITIVPHQKSFTFDYMFDTESTQEQVFLGVASGLVDRFLDGYNVTILAYGQTSSGKTYSMGTAMDCERHPDPEQEGIIPRAMTALFQRLQKNQPTPTSPCTSQSSTRRPSANSLPLTSGLRAPRRTTSLAKLRPTSMVTPVRRPSGLNPPEKNDNSKAPRYTVHVSFVEIYNEELIDLLNPAPPSERPAVTIREDTKGHIYWTGVKEVAVGTTEDVLRYLQMGTQNRATGSTDMNAKSSRSHAIFSVTLKQEKWVPASEAKSQRRRETSPSPASSRSSMASFPMSRRASTLNVKAMVGQMEKQNHGPKPTGAAAADEEDGEWMVLSSKFHFVDLAGSERLKRTAAEGDRRKEGININAGLLALGNVISALSDPCKRSTHVPYRDSKLTRLLQDSLGGNATTLMIACVSPAEINLTETVNTIKYAHRARSIKNKTERNEAEEWMTNDNADYLRGLIAKLKAEVRTLKAHGPPTSPKQPLTHFVHHTDVSPSSSLSDHDHPQISTCPSSSATTTITVPDMEFDNNQALVADLRRQIEELHNEVTVTRERNQLVETELRQSRQQANVKSPLANKRHARQTSPRSSKTDSGLSNVDFQHLVEPVIEEYEKSISGLESQLAMARAALAHSDHALAAQEAKIAEYETMHEIESRNLAELRHHLAQLTEQGHTNEAHIAELEAKLAQAQVDQPNKNQNSDTASEASTQTLESQIAEKTAQVDELQHRLADVETMHRELAELRDTQAHEIERLHQTVENAKQELEQQKKLHEEEQATSLSTIEQLQATIDGLTADKESMKEALAEAQMSAQDLRKHMWEQEQGTQLTLRLRLEELERVKLDLHALRLVEEKQDRIIVGLELKLEEMERMTLGLKEQLAVRDRQITQLEQENTAKTEFAQEMQVQVCNLLRQINGMGLEKKELEMLLNIVDGLLQKQETVSAKHMQLIDDLKQKCLLREEAYEEQQRITDLLETQKKEHTASLQAMEDRSSDNDQLTQVLESELADAKATLEEQAALVKQLQQQDKHHQAELERLAHLDDHVNQLETTLTKVQQDHQNAIQELAQKQDEMNKLQRSCEKATEKVARLEKTIEEMEKTIETHRELVAANDASGMIVDLQEKLKTLQHAKEEQGTTLERQLDQLHEDLETSQRSNQDQEHVITSLKETVETLKQQLEEAIASHTQKSGQIQMLQEQLTTRRRVSSFEEARKRTSDSDKSRESSSWSHTERSSMSSTNGQDLLRRIEEQEAQIREKDENLTRLTKAVSDLEEKRKSRASQMDRDEFKHALAKKLQDPQGQQELIDKIAQLTEDNSQLVMHVDDLEAQLVLQRSQLTLETKNLELEVMKLTAANDRLEKEMEQVMPRSSHSHVVSRESSNYTSPPQTPRVVSPSNSSLHYKLQRDMSSTSLKLQKSSSYRSMTLPEDDEASKRVSSSSMRSELTPRPNSSLRNRSVTPVANLPPPSAPPSNPLPPIPTPLPPIPVSPSSLPGSPSVGPTRSVSSPLLQRQNSSSTSFSDALMNNTLTSEQYDKIVRSLQRKAQVAENDVRAHQEVISKLETQLSRSESSVRDVKKQLDVLNREKQACNLEIQNLRAQVTQIQTQQKATTEQAEEERRELEELLEKEKKLKEKAEKARHILESRMEELMNKKNKFMCF
ncbi:uncharacterized protein BYT42DRAFT_564774 [Radiomyces spectabilis]|uniref:uncharacterized protein n=1 Tax=Radiomyces spectabilis TaxID=64574 RepID=UPI00221FE0C0|nr:uncharacterized protein BYT42DRAFT_564774 [Radiomyces spectabilis]KAI8380958.1 hypothetical protein BYT42DRAFT_564774 [Radiomyces spectabilis]